jgi:putative hydrolase of the HAD superfamily
VDRITTIFCDVGGVILTNGWDHVARRAAADHFALDQDDFETRHERALPDFETGRLGLDEYLARTIFHRERDFTPKAFADFMFSRSEAHPEALSALRRVAAAGGHLLATLNNESLALNEYRIRRFGLADCFALFLSSCYLGARKPGEEIYRRALGIVRRPPGECLFIDDREENLAVPRRLGMRTIAYAGPAQLVEELRKAGVAPDVP